ncbi:DUF1801 domain-containing protein [Jannaschia pohangensis]|uniref:YdhG-like domain-containing protein n=1 Tax=Jannaschia pohangensis TaxID=390807 RepID=A0A1I3IAW7_9RHOB|nr:DUF1801 domain-containing protein [Jannaschia pohangensis]SFI44977.1 protein of unknown function (DU1801) [Jannaschia pohangensis]
MTTRPPSDDATAFLAAQRAPRDSEGAALDALFRKATGFAPRLWSGGIVGYGSYDYTYASGRSGTSLATGFSPRKAAISIYIMPGYADFGDILSRLGPHQMGKSCLRVTRLARIDTDVLAELVAAGLADLARRWPIRA